MRRMQKTDRLLTPVFDELDTLYKDWQKIVTKVFWYMLAL